MEWIIEDLFFQVFFYEDYFMNETDICYNINSYLTIYYYSSLRR